jgi:hypothetical protein
MRKGMLAGVALCLSMLVSVAAHAATTDGAGSPPTCPAKGSLKLKPALVIGGAEAGTLKFSSKSSGVCSGGLGDGSTIVSYKMKGAGTTTANTCTDLGGASSSDLAMTFKWKVAKGSPKLTASTATFSVGASGVTGGGDQAFYLQGTITAGSFVGKEVTVWVESDETAATLLGQCSAKGIKIVKLGDDDATSSCTNGPNMAAAITMQITSLDSNDVPHLELEITTVTASPYELTASDIDTTTAGVLLESLSTTCAQDPAPLYTYRCRHTARYISSGACQWDGDYTLAASYGCDPANTCDLCEGIVAIPVTLDSENFCGGGTETCTVDLSCSQATAGASTGGVPCCSDTYNPLIECLEANCATDCAAVISADAGIVPASPCHTCVFSNCNSTYNACSGDNETCLTE